MQVVGEWLEEQSAIERMAGSEKRGRQAAISKRSISPRPGGRRGKQREWGNGEEDKEAKSISLVQKWRKGEGGRMGGRTRMRPKKGGGRRARRTTRKEGGRTMGTGTAEGPEEADDISNEGTEG